jgi:chitin disaccharide deacetylase
MTVEPSDEKTPYAVINIDDVGMCHGANVAFLELKRMGAVDSGSVMVPCPWFLEIAEAGAEDPSLELGLHVTLTSEKKYYRWRPLTKASKVSGLVDADGFLWRSVPELRRSAHAEAVEAEIRAQLEAAQAAGLHLAHIDGHMGAVFAPEFVDVYASVAIESGLPTLFPASMENYDPIHNLGQVDMAVYAAPIERLKKAGQVLATEVLETPWHRKQPAKERYRTLFSKIGEGLNFLCLHANAPGDIEAIEPSSAQIRMDEYELLKRPEFADWVARQGFRRGTLREATN